MATERSTYKTAKDTARRADAEGKRACAELFEAYRGFFTGIVERIYPNQVPEDLRDVKLMATFQTSDMNFTAGADGTFVLFYARRALKGPKQGENEIVLRIGSVTVKSPGSNSGAKLSLTAQDITLWDLVNNIQVDELFKVKDRPFRVESTAVFLEWVQSLAGQKGFRPVDGSQGQK